MSHGAHPTLSAWQRDHERGGYVAEINGWTLHVAWRPEDESGHRGFSWEARRPEGATVAASEIHEEIEMAMAEAEQVAVPKIG